MQRSTIPAFFFSKREMRMIVDAIKAAEDMTSGEIRVHVARASSEHILDDAKATFEKLGMTKTAQHNGVLIYFAIKNRAFSL